MPKKSAKAVTPLIDLAGSAGNMQDVSDLQKMLAQSQYETAMMERSVERLKKTIQTLTEQRDTAERDKAELRRKIEQLTEEKSELLGRAESAEANTDTAEDERDAAQAEHNDLVAATVELIKIRDLLSAGNARAARDEVDRVLQVFDPCWRTGGCNVAADRFL